VADEHAMKNVFTLTLLKIKRFRISTSGNVAIIFGLTLVPLMIITGIAVDYSGASGISVKLQSATDAAVLAGASVSPWSEAACTALALEVFDGRVNDQSLTSAHPATVTCGENGTSLAGQAQVPTSMLGVAGIKSIELAASSSATCSMQAEAGANSRPIAWQQPWLPDRTRVVTLGTTISGVVHYWRTVDGNPLVRLDNPFDGPATIVIRSVPAAPTGNMSFNVPARGQFFVMLPFVPAGVITLFVQDGPSPVNGGSASWNNDNNRQFTDSQIPGTPIYDQELVRRCWISQ
jgi:hypothetical protein